MTVREFLLYHTQIGELCVITLDGWIAATAYIDAEDLFTLDAGLRDATVVSDKRKDVTVTTNNGKNTFMAHFVNATTGGK